MARASAVIIIVSLLAFSIPAHAGAPSDRVQSAAAAVIATVTRPDLQGDANRIVRRAALRNIADDLFDFREMARVAIGYHWAMPSESEMAEFVALFAQLLERSYVTTIENYAGERILYTSETIDANYATVRSKIVTTRRAEISVDYRLRKSSTGWFVVDVTLENVSLVANYREQINRVLRTASFRALLERMQAGELTAVAIPRPGGNGR
jgi:phospholipid transport system substrate-binding protein